MSEEMYRDRIEITLILVIDVTDEPEGLTETTKEVLRRLVSEDDDVRVQAEEDIAMAFIAESPGACTMSYGADSAEAIENLKEIGALSCEPSPEITEGAAVARMCGDKEESDGADKADEST